MHETIHHDLLTRNIIPAQINFRHILLLLHVKSTKYMTYLKTVKYATK